MPRPEIDPSIQGEAISIPVGAVFEEIATLEDRRTTGDGRLVQLLTSPEAAVRRRAARALGRLSFPEFGADVTDALVRALKDADTNVRIEALFSLGLRADPRSAGVLATYHNDPNPLIRVRVIEAASRLDDAAVHQELVVHLRDSSLDVRIATVEATARWSRDQEGGQAVDRALIDALSPYTLGAPTAGSPRVREVETEIAWRILFALARRGSPLGRGAFLEYATSSIPLERLFAVRGLGRLADAENAEEDVEVVQILASALTDPNALGAPDWRVAYEAAIALGKWGHADGLKPLLDAVEDKNPHVRSAALSALANFPDHLEALLPVLHRGLLDISTEARIAALGSIARLLPAEGALLMVDKVAGEDDPVCRAGAASAAGILGSPSAVAVLERLLADTNPLVAGAAVSALGEHGSSAARDLLHGLLASPNNSMRLNAIYALQNMPDPSDVEPLLAAAKAEGEISTEIAFSVLENLGRIGGDAARDAIYAAASDSRPHVRRVARRLLKLHFDLEVPAQPTAPLEATVTIAGRDYPSYETNPLVAVTTTRGTMLFELFPAEAPLHVANFLELAKSGHYDGLIFHRVVPDFVIQGGDLRGDGNGASPWRGDALRHEFTPRRYLRGALGMPRNEEFDSGGSQFFVTHRPTPHLDGRYTLFGQLRAGGEVLDRIEVGDRILRVQERP